MSMMVGRISRMRVFSMRAALLASVACGAMLSGGMPVPAAMAQQQGYEVEIPAGPLSLALNRLAAQTGLQIGFDSSVVAGMTTGGLSGNYGASEALVALLAGTDIEPRFSDARTVTLVQTGASDQFTGPVTGLPDDGSTVLDTIMVMGEKFPRDWFDTYTSVSVATGEDIVERNTTELTEVIDAAPNVMSGTSSQGDNNIVIRGLNAEGVTQPSRSTPVVSVIVDGVPQSVEALRRGSRGVWDVEQVEVLRGPQSTLQGRNALGGAVVVETNDPTWDTEFIVDGQIGSDDLHSGAFVINLPLLQDQLAVRIAGQAAYEDSGISYADPEMESLGEDEFEEIRAKILFTPDALPEFSALFTISRTHDKPGWNLVSGPDFFARQYVEAPGDTAAEFRDFYVNRYSAELTYDINPDWQIKSITSYSDTNGEIWNPTSQAPYFRTGDRESNDFTQDIRLTYDNPDSAFSGVFGFFAGRTRTINNSEISTELSGLPIQIQDIYAETTTESIAAYADMRYDLTEQWTLLGGGRLLRDKVSADYSGTAFNQGLTLVNLFGCGPAPDITDPGYPAYVGCAFSSIVNTSLEEDSSASFTEFLPKIGLAYEFTDTQTVSAMVSKGYRPGFTEYDEATATVRQIDPEYLWSYELGYRGKWLDDRLEIAANAFYYDYKNQQVVSSHPSIPAKDVTVNSGKSHSYGAEIEARFRPNSQLELFSSIGLLKTEFDEGVSDGDSFAGSEFPESPSFTARFGGMYTFENGVFVGGDISYTDGYYSRGDLNNVAVREVDSYTLVNAQVGWETETARISLFAKNLLDEEYLTYVDSSTNYAAVGKGRQFGLHANVKF